MKSGGLLRLLAAGDAHSYGRALVVKATIFTRMGDWGGRTVEKDASAPYYWAAFQIIGDWQ